MDLKKVGEQGRDENTRSFLTWKYDGKEDKKTTLYMSM